MDILRKYIYPIVPPSHTNVGSIGILSCISLTTPFGLIQVCYSSTVVNLVGEKGFEGIGS
jgi:hypothetical protein